MNRPSLCAVGQRQEGFVLNHSNFIDNILYSFSPCGRISESSLNLFPLFFRIGPFFLPTSTISFPHFLPFINIIQKFIKSVFSFSLNVFPVEIKDRSTGGQIRELEINMVSSWISYPQLAIGSMNQTMSSLSKNIFHLIPEI